MACIVLFISMLLHIDRLFHILQVVFPLDLNKAKRVLRFVCTEISKLENFSSGHFAQPILEAACQNAYQVVREILYHSLGATLESTDKNGHDIIQLAIINRSEKIYNLIYDIGERKDVYRTRKDSYENNILHFAGKLAPSSVLNRRTGAALQLQREIQWLQEVKKFVFPSYTTQENIDKETPYMVFTREHKELLKEGEQWMKTTAESCSITTSLIVTIVFAGAITVPGGSNQEKGTPLFKSKAAFIIFAIADAISLFASSTALLVFLSILTTRFAENVFLVSLPRRLFIGIFSLLLSTTTMMVTFSATLFLVFCDNKPWMLAPISGLAFIPIAFFVNLQFPLIVDLLRSTYSPIFGKHRKSTNLDMLVDGILELVEGILDKVKNWFTL
ncbi:putative PGG domain, ankyrin repeat-containing domain superfamily [Helianthus anomalus]